MGVPKFFRYISERYPCLSEQLKEYQIPEFDNLYLDMNGIIHTCSHPNDADVQFRITEETIFKNIFHYVEILFRIIQPRKVFFMAVDGVAPRAKINQQRGRRFRSAKEAEVLEAKAKAKGIDIPKEARFDSNCITPGTLFMAKLNKQLKYFISYKISTDKLWQNCTVIFSGSEVPGEGEHKIMDYIRYMKSQPNYDPDTRHCLYGLDADLIMLGLCTHEPHFSLLREEVVFEKKQKRIMTPEETHFCLLHLSLMREYLEHEFSPVKDKLPFPYDIEKIIDDWVLIGFLVGNDFIPHLPNLHIAQGILPILYNAYMEILPTLDGYINEAGTLKLDRFEKFMEKLSHLDLQQFEEVYADLKYFEAKTGRRPNENERFSYKHSDDSPDEEVSKHSNKALEALIKATDDMTLELSDEDDDTDSDTYNLEFIQHKKDYYMNKLEYGNVDADVLRIQAEGYVRAIQWNLHYYYNGCCSWSWFYPHHYAPYISDIKDFKNLKIEFDYGQPFLPFQQLLAVLPAASKALLPKAYQTLLTEKRSPIIDYYPLEFKTDLNGKKQEWEAVVLIPFIDEKKLLKAIDPHNINLVSDELERNKHGPMCIFTYTDKETGMCSAPEYFPSFQSHASIKLVNREDIFVPQENLVKGLCPKVKFSVYFPGFPTLQYIEHTAKLEKAKVKIFEHAARGESIILYITPKPKPDLYAVAQRLLGKNIFINWPHLVEAQVVAVSDSNVKLNFSNLATKQGDGDNFIKEDLKGILAQQWIAQRKTIVENYKIRMGIELNDVEFLVHARPIIGRRYVFGTRNKLTLEKQWNEHASAYAYQAIVEDITVHDMSFVQFKSVDEIFVPKSICFMLGHPHYGAMGEVTEPGVDIKTGRVKVAMKISVEPDFENVRKKEAESRMRYMHGSVAAQHLGISSHLLSRITGTILVAEPTNDQGNLNVKHNIGLNLKFNKKNEEVPGFTKKDNGMWLYSMKSIDLIRSYMQKCPEVFEKLDRGVGSTDIFSRDELFPNGASQLEETVVWLKEQQKIHCLESRACGREFLEPELIKLVEEEADVFLHMKSNAGKMVLMQVKPYLLYKPGLNDKTFQPDSEASHKILDRIVVVRESYTVPIGYKGTIVEIQRAENPLESIYEILFDKSFVGGLTLYGCSPHRLYRLLATDFINLSHGLRIELGKSVKTETPAVLNWRLQQQPSPMQLQKQPRANVSAFASLGPSNFFTPMMVQQNPRMPPVGKVGEQQVGVEKPGFETQKRTQTPIKMGPHQQVKLGQTTEFQALWNELHKVQAQPELRPCFMPSKSTPSIKPTQIKANSNTVQQPVQQAPQDPSAFLKAMLKISDDSSQKTAPQTSKSSDAPPLVQQLFDYARQVEKRKENIWHCTQLLTYYQLNCKGFPRYFYIYNNSKTLVCAQIILPDMRVFYGDFCATSSEAAENAAKKVCKELEIDNMSASKITPSTPPQQWFNSQQGANMSQICPQPMQPPIPPNFPKTCPTAPNIAMSMPRPKWSTVPPPPQPSFPTMTSSQDMWKHHPQQTNVDKRADTVKTEVKKSTPFVPLQAEKKNRNAISKASQNKGKSNKEQGNKEPAKQTMMPQSSKDVSQKELKEEKPRSEKQVSNAHTFQKSQRAVRRKKSRIAANFASASTLNGGNGLQQ